MSPALQADSLPTESQGKPKNTGVGSLSLLQRIFVTQEWDRSLLRCRQLLYQLSYERSTKACGLHHGSLVVLYSPLDFAKCTMMSCMHHDSVIHDRFTVPILLVPCPHLPEVRWRLHERGCWAFPRAQEGIHHQPLRSFWALHGDL